MKLKFNHLISYFDEHKEDLGRDYYFEQLVSYIGRFNTVSDLMDACYEDLKNDNPYMFNYEHIKIIKELVLRFLIMHWDMEY